MKYIVRLLSDDGLESADNLPSPDVLAREIIEDLAAHLSNFALLQAI